LLAAAVMLIALNWPLTFFQDAWAFLMERRPNDAHSFLAPQNEHLVVLQVAVLKLFVALFGLGNNHGEMLFNVAAMLGAGALLFVWARRRVQDWVALLAACLLLFLGSAWQVLLWPFEMEFTVPLVAGIGVLLALERDDERGDLLALLLLLVAIGFGSFGLSFAFAAFVDICLKHRRRGWGRLWIVVVPLILYLAWYAGWGHDAEHHLTLRNILASPLYTFEGVASALASVTGLSTATTTGTPEPDWGRPLLIALVGLAIWAKRRRPGFDQAFWPLLAVVLSYWLLAAFNFIPGREPGSLRYQYSGGALVILLAVELLRGWHFSKQALWIAAGVAALMIAPNLAQLGSGHEWFKEQTALTRADTGAIEIASQTVAPTFRLTPEIAGTPSLINVDAEDLLGAVEEHGSAGYSPAELATASSPARHWGDVVLSQASGMSTAIVAGGYDAAAAKGTGCTEVAAGGADPPEVALAAGVNRVYVAEGGEAKLTMRRFATGEYPVPLQSAPGGSKMEIKVPADNAPEYPWYLHVEAAQTATVCPAG
jgi:hypothetical protein